jgi:hypothetical protein
MDCGSIPPCMYLSLSLRVRVRVWDCRVSLRRAEAWAALQAGKLLTYIAALFAHHNIETA